MRVGLTGRHVEISPALRNLVTRKVAKIQRLVNDTGVATTVVLTKEKINNRVEIALHARGERFLHAAARADIWETALTDAVAKVLHQMERVKSKWQERKRRGPAARSVKTPAAAKRRIAARTTATRTRR